MQVAERSSSDRGCTFRVAQDRNVPKVVPGAEASKPDVFPRWVSRAPQRYVASLAHLLAVKPLLEALASLGDLHGCTVGTSAVWNGGGGGGNRRRGRAARSGGKRERIVWCKQLRQRRVNMRGVRWSDRRARGGESKTLMRGSLPLACCHRTRQGRQPRHG